MTTLLLTNRFEKFRLYYALALVFVGTASWFYLIGKTGCNVQKNQDIPDVAYKARAGGGYFMEEPKGKSFYIITSNGDTTFPIPKPQIKVKYNHYLLNGNDTLFRLLFLQVESPLDITPRNLQILKNWLNTNIKIDSSGR